MSLYHDQSRCCTSHIWILFCYILNPRPVSLCRSQELLEDLPITSISHINQPVLPPPLPDPTQHNPTQPKPPQPNHQPIFRFLHLPIHTPSQRNRHTHTHTHTHAHTSHITHITHITQHLYRIHTITNPTNFQTAITITTSSITQLLQTTPLLPPQTTLN